MQSDLFGKQRKTERKLEAQDRKEARANRSDAEQLLVLHDRGITWGREYTRLTERVLMSSENKRGRK